MPKNGQITIHKTVRDIGTSIDRQFVRKKRTREEIDYNKKGQVQIKPEISRNEIMKSSNEKRPSEKLKDEKKIQELKVCERVSLKPSDQFQMKRKRKKGYSDFKFGLLFSQVRDPLKVLLAFNQLDPVGKTYFQAAEKLVCEVIFCPSEDTVLEELQTGSFDVIIIDARNSKTIDYDTLSRTIKNTRWGQLIRLIAVVSRSLFETDDVCIMDLLQIGFNRCIPETTNITVAVNELNQLKHCDVKDMNHQAVCQTLHAALEKCKDIVIVTDDNYRCQYLNKMCEKILNVRMDECLGKMIQEQITPDNFQITTMGSLLSRGKEWLGPINLKKKNQEIIQTSCKASPVSYTGKVPTHFVLVFELSNSLDAVQTTAPGSVYSIKRESNFKSDASDFMRRSSVAKLNALPLESPFTKIIALMEKVRENSLANTQVVQLLDKVEDMLRTSELYDSNIKEFRTDEPIVSELITALLSKQPQPHLATSRKSSVESSLFRASKAGIIKMSIALRDLLETSFTWEFDIFRLEDLTKKRPLQYLGMTLFLHFDVPATLSCDERTLFNWLTVIEANYHLENSYHNSTHAADVMQATAGFLCKDKMKNILDPLDEVISLIAAAAHDVDHPGKSSAFLSNSDNPLAILYNDVTILESHHAAFMFKLTLGDERVNILKNLDRETYKIARHNVIDMILATEMTKHFEHLAKFVNVFCIKSSGSHTEISNQEFVPITLPENITLIKRMMIKCSDVSNPTRPLRLCVEWARRIAEEYFQQTDEEKFRGLPVVMPMFDRNTCSIPKSQIGFVDYIINDMFEAWNAFIDMPELITYMRQNYIRWKEFDEQGHTTLNDIRKLQNTVLMTPMFPMKHIPRKSES